MPIDDRPLGQMIIAAREQAKIDIRTGAARVWQHAFFLQSLLPGYHTTAFQLKVCFSGMATRECGGHFVLRQDKECITPTCSF